MKPSDEEERQLARHQAGADHTDLGHRPGERAVRGADRTPGALLDQVERVQPGSQLVAHQQVGERVVLGRGAGIEVSGARLSDQVQRPIGSAGTAVQAEIDAGSAGPDDAGPVVCRVAVPGHGHLAGDDPGRPPQGLGQEVRIGEQHVDDAELGGLLRPQHAVLVQRIVDDDLDRRRRSDQPRQQLGAAPAGHEAEEHLRERDGGDAGREGPVVAVQREFQPAAERRAVQEREGRHGTLEQPPEDPMAELGDLPALHRVPGSAPSH